MSRRRGMKMARDWSQNRAFRPSGSSYRGMFKVQYEFAVEITITADFLFSLSRISRPRLAARLLHARNALRQSADKSENIAIKNKMLIGSFWLALSSF